MKRLLVAPAALALAGCGGDGLRGNATILPGFFGMLA